MVQLVLGGAGVALLAAPTILIKMGWTAAVGFLVFAVTISFILEVIHPPN